MGVGLRHGERLDPRHQTTYHVKVLWTVLRSCVFILSAMDGMPLEVFNGDEREQDAHMSMSASETITADSKREQIERCTNRCLRLLD